MWGEPAAAALSHLINVVSGRRRSRSVYALGTGVRHASLTINEFVQRCESDPELLQLCTKVIMAAQDTIFQGRLEALARSLASALEDGSRVNEEILFTSVLAQLEPPHVRLLAHMEGGPSDEDHSYNRLQLAQLDPGLEHVLEPLLSTLAGYGLVVRRSPAGIAVSSGGPEIVPYVMTAFGKHMLNRIRQPVQGNDTTS
jgi:hypothetical protein